MRTVTFRRTKQYEIKRLWRGALGVCVCVCARNVHQRQHLNVRRLHSNFDYRFSNARCNRQTI